MGKDGNRSWAGPPGREKPVDIFRDVVDGLGLSTGEILGSFLRSSNVSPADLDLESEIRSSPELVFIPSNIASAVGLSSGSRESRRLRNV